MPITPPKPYNGPYNSYLAQLKNLLFKPNLFFEGVRQEREYLGIIIKYIIFMTLLNVIVFFVGMYNDLQIGVSEVIVSIVSIILIALLGLFLPFVNAAIVHLGVLLFGGSTNKDYFVTFKVATYTLFIGTIYAAITTIIEGISQMIWPTANLTDVILQLPLVIITTIIGVVGTVHMIWAMVTGLKSYYSLTTGKALLSTLVIPGILILIVLSVIFLIVFTIAAMPLV